MLEKVRLWDYRQGFNIGAYTDGYSYEEYGRLYLLSVVGQDSSVKAITSGLVSSREAEILSTQAISVFAPSYCKYRILGTKLRCGQLHQIILVDSFFNPEGQERLLFVEDEREKAQVLYQQINKRFPVPLVPQWSQWLYRKLREQGAFEELEGNIKVIKLNVSEQVLDELISEGVRSGEIEF